MRRRGKEEELHLVQLTSPSLNFPFFISYTRERTRWHSLLTAAVGKDLVAHLKQLKRLLHRSISPWAGWGVMTSDLLLALVADIGMGPSDELPGEAVELGVVV